MNQSKVLVAGTGISGIAAAKLVLGHDHHGAVLQRGYRPPGDSSSGQLHHTDRKSRPHRPGVPHFASGRNRSVL